VTRCTVETFSTSNADDLSFLALADIARLTADVEDARIVGGHMVGMLQAAFPVAGATVRRTIDADTAVSTQVASSGQLHARLLADGYVATSGNSYEKPPGMVVDVLVPATQTTFEPVEVGERTFDAAPGIRLALSIEPIFIEVKVTMLDGARLELEIRVPTVEVAIILKAYAFQSRRSVKDVVDLFSLLEIAHTHELGDPTNWKLLDTPISGGRLDASRILHRLADNASRPGSDVLASGVKPEVFAALVRTLVTPSIS
jgi:hypothetical protein